MRDLESGRFRSYRNPRRHALRPAVAVFLTSTATAELSARSPLRKDRPIFRAATHSMPRTTALALALLTLSASSCSGDTAAREGDLIEAHENARKKALESPTARRISSAIRRLDFKAGLHRERARDQLSRRSFSWDMTGGMGNRWAARAELRHSNDAKRQRRQLEAKLAKHVESDIAKSLGSEKYAQVRAIRARRAKAKKQRPTVRSKSEETRRRPTSRPAGR